jgi:hypothetical protein
MKIRAAGGGHPRAALTQSLLAEPGLKGDEVFAIDQVDQSVLLADAA